MYKNHIIIYFFIFLFLFFWSKRDFRLWSGVQVHIKIQSKSNFHIYPRGPTFNAPLFCKMGHYSCIEPNGPNSHLLHLFLWQNGLDFPSWPKYLTTPAPNTPRSNYFATCVDCSFTDNSPSLGLLASHGQEEPLPHAVPSSRLYHHATPHQNSVWRFLSVVITSTLSSSTCTLMLLDYNPDMSMMKTWELGYSLMSAGVTTNAQVSGDCMHLIDNTSLHWRHRSSERWAPVSVLRVCWHCSQWREHRL